MLVPAPGVAGIPHLLGEVDIEEVRLEEITEHQVVGPLRFREERRGKVDAVARKLPDVDRPDIAEHFPKLALHLFDEVEIVPSLEPFHDVRQGRPVFVVVGDDDEMPRDPVHLRVQQPSLRPLQPVGHVSRERNVETLVLEGHAPSGAGLHELDSPVLGLARADAQHALLRVHPRDGESSLVQHGAERARSTANIDDAPMRGKPQIGFQPVQHRAELPLLEAVVQAVDRRNRGENACDHDSEPHNRELRTPARVPSG